MTLYEQFAEYTSGNDIFENDDDKESVLTVVNLYADHPELGIKTINHSSNRHCDLYKKFYNKSPPGDGIRRRKKENMTAEERNKYIEFMYDYKNEYNCENCPENRDDFPHDKLPCGQQNCWVTCHCKEM